MERKVIPSRPLSSALLVALILAGLYAIELVDQLMFGGGLDSNGIYPRSLFGLDGILWAPLLHDGWGHLLANTLPILVLGWLVMSGGMAEFVAVTATVWVLGGSGTWLFGAEGTHVGASGVAFGWLVFLLVRGFFNRSAAQIIVSILLFLYWGSMLWGVLPGQPGISWEGHLFGAIGGFLAAWFISRQNRSVQAVR